MKKRALLFLVVAICTASIICFSQVNQRSTKIFPGIKKLMSHDDFTKAGLSKLNDDEIAALDEWLQRFALDVSKTVAIKPSSDVGGGAIETYVDGDFNGWDGETIWKMDNGQIWQQSAYAFHFHYAYHPKVLIYSTSAGWKMKVDGDDGGEGVSVKRIK